MLSGGDAVTVDEALQRIGESHGPASGVWWIQGADLFLRDRVVEALTRSAGDGASRRRWDGAQDLTDVALWLNTTGFFDEARLGYWREPDAGSLKRAGWADVAAASVGGRAVVVWSTKSGPPRDAKAVLVQAEPLKGAQWAALVQSEERRRKLSLNRDVDQYVTEACRPDGHYLTASLDKLGLAKAAGVDLSLASAQRLVAPIGESALYLLSDALMRRASGSALDVARQHLARGTAPALLLVVMSRQMLLLAEWLHDQAAGASVDEFIAAHGLRSWQARLYREAGRVWTIPAAESWIYKAGRVDVALKHSQGDAAVWIEGLILSAAR